MRNSKSLATRRAAVAAAKAARSTGAAMGLGLVLAAAVGLGGSGCGGSDGTGTPPPTDNLMPSGGPADAQSYFPLTRGKTWTYNLVRQGIPKMKAVTVEGAEDLSAPKAGVTAVRLREEQDGEVQLTWFERRGDTSVVIHRQMEMDAASTVKWNEWYTPSASRIEESTDMMRVGGTWTAEFDVSRTSVKNGEETKHKIHQFDVESMDETVTVPAGTFQTVRVRRMDPVDGSYRQYWYASGVGKVRELEYNGDSEELVATGGGGAP